MRSDDCWEEFFLLGKQKAMQTNKSSWHRGNGNISLGCKFFMAPRL